MNYCIGILPTIVVLPNKACVHCEMDKTKST